MHQRITTLKLKGLKTFYCNTDSLFLSAPFKFNLASKLRGRLTRIGNFKEKAKPPNRMIFLTTNVYIYQLFDSKKNIIATTMRLVTTIKPGKILKIR